jgi:hypothetical protein
VSDGGFCFVDGCQKEKQKMSEMALFVIALPEELKIALAGLVLAGVRLLLAGRVPDAYISEVAAVITTAIITIIELSLGLIPGEFEMVVAAVLRLIAILLGMVFAANGYRLFRALLHARGLRA